jgi:hypothetical protein
LLPVSLNVYSLHSATSTTARSLPNPTVNAKSNDVIKQTGLEPNDLYQMIAQMKDASDIYVTHVLNTALGIKELQPTCWR